MISVVVELRLSDVLRNFDAERTISPIIEQRAQVIAADAAADWPVGRDGGTRSRDAWRVIPLPMAPPPTFGWGVLNDARNRRGDGYAAYVRNAGVATPAWEEIAEDIESRAAPILLDDIADAVVSSLR